MREIRQSGSEGGAGQTNVPFLPLSILARGALLRGFPILQKTGSIQAGSSKNFVAKGSAEWIRSTFTP
jgi:hypothetical protein